MKKTINHQELRIIKLQKKFFDAYPLKGYVASHLFLDLAPEI